MARSHMINILKHNKEQDSNKSLNITKSEILTENMDEKK